MTSFNVAGLLHEPPGATRDVRLRDHYVTLGSDIELAGPLDAATRQRLLEIADKCPVHRTLTSEIRIETRMA